MKIKEAIYIALGASLILSLISLIAKLDKNTISNLANVATMLGPPTTVLTIVIAYLAFLNQSKTNTNAQSLQVLNQLITEAADIRRRLDSTYLELDAEGKNTETGIKAAKAFLSEFHSYDDDTLEGYIGHDMIHTKPFQLLNYMYQLVTGLEDILRLARNGFNEYLNKEDQLRSRAVIQTIVTHYWQTYNQVFVRIAASISGKKLGAVSNRSKNVEKVLDQYEIYIQIMQELKSYGYLVEKEDHQADIEDLDNLENLQPLKDRIANLLKLDYRIPK